MITAPYGSWKSPITPQLLVERVVGLSYPVADGPDRYWVEARPAEAGRQVVVRRRGDRVDDVIPAGFSARTLVHEYGGRCYAVRGGVLWSSNFADQRLYRVDHRGAVPITPEGPVRYADPVLTPDGRWLICVREQHLDREVVNDLVAVPADGGDDIQVVASGHDFFAAPRVSPSGRLAWLAWDHPRMPWDGTELYEAAALGSAGRAIAGGPGESVTRPGYAPDGRLHFISDRTGWWNLYRADDAGVIALAPRSGEFAAPDWVFGESSYAFLDDGTLVAAWTEEGATHLGVVGVGGIQEVAQPFSSLVELSPAGQSILAVAASPTEGAAVVEIEVPSGAWSVLKASRDTAVGAEFISVPRPVTFPTGDHVTAHGWFYPPTNPDYAAAAEERPPLIVLSHGGPTSAARPILNYGLQFWTSRGFAVVDVDYRGSAGYGRAYRDQLAGRWGIADVEDCVSAARWLVAEGAADPQRLLIRGGSAGGYTTLCALTFTDVFAAGASHYGVADIAALARDTHKFESRYLDGLIGPWPAAEAVYRERSPIFHVDQLKTPLIMFQGLDDRVVPPNQAEMMAEALRANRVPFALIAYEGEQHGFRIAANIVRTAEAELAFYGLVLGFDPADPIEPIPMENADALAGRAGLPR